jgi:hypothetical protein
VISGLVLVPPNFFAAVDELHPLAFYRQDDAVVVLGNGVCHVIARFGSPEGVDERVEVAVDRIGFVFGAEVSVPAVESHFALFYFLLSNLFAARSSLSAAIDSMLTLPDCDGSKLRMMRGRGWREALFLPKILPLASTRNSAEGRPSPNDVLLGALADSHQGLSRTPVRPFGPRPNDIRRGPFPSQFV